MRLYGNTGNVDGTGCRIHNGHVLFYVDVGDILVAFWLVAHTQGPAASLCLMGAVSERQTDRQAGHIVNE